MLRSSTTVRSSNEECGFPVALLVLDFARPSFDAESSLPQRVTTPADSAQ
jgi:hypothetical protein